MLNNRKPVVKCPEVYPSGPSSASCVCALGLAGLWARRQRTEFTCSIPLAQLHLQASERVMGIRFHSTGWGRGQRDEFSSREIPPRPKTLSSPQVLPGRPGIEHLPGTGGGETFPRTLPKAKGLVAEVPRPRTSWTRVRVQDPRAILMESHPL